MKAWKEACQDGANDSTLIIPQNKTFLLKPLKFSGPYVQVFQHPSQGKNSYNTIYVVPTATVIVATGKGFVIALPRLCECCEIYEKHVLK